MTGAKNFVKGKNYITFKVPKAMNSIGYIKIEINPLDMYNMTFMTRNGRIIKIVDGIYWDQLQQVFTENTGLYTHL